MYICILYTHTAIAIAKAHSEGVQRRRTTKAYYVYSKGALTYTDTGSEGITDIIQQRRAAGGVLHVKKVGRALSRTGEIFSDVEK
jgi:hypothetical protein